MTLNKYGHHSAHHTINKFGGRRHFNIGGQRLTHLGAPIKGKDAVTKEYVDKLVQIHHWLGSYVDIGNKRLVRVRPPIDIHDAVTKGYLNERIQELKSQIIAEIGILQGLQNGSKEKKTN